MQFSLKRRMFWNVQVGLHNHHHYSTIEGILRLPNYRKVEKEMDEKAMELLQCTGMKIGEITELCGYKDQYYFSHCFKKLTGVSPNKYRREHEQA